MHVIWACQIMLSVQYELITDGVWVKVGYNTPKVSHYFRKRTQSNIFISLWFLKYMGILLAFEDPFANLRLPSEILISDLECAYTKNLVQAVCFCQIKLLN